MKFILSIFCLCLFVTPALLEAQEKQPKLSSDKLTFTMKPTAGEPVSRAAFINPMAPNQPVYWDAKLSYKGGTSHGVDLQDELDVMKAEKTAKKIAALKANKTKLPDPEDPGVEKMEADRPVVLTSFEANTFDNRAPPDNDMAISDDGHIVAVINSSMAYFDTDGNNIMGDIRFENLFTDLDLSSSQIFDPKVLYDPVDDRFILVVLSGSSADLSTVVVGFSVSQDPADGWNFYTFSGAFMQGSWFDYPNIAISEHDLFISGNLFNDNDGFEQTVLLQIRKEEGYQGEDLLWEHFNDVSTSSGSSAFTLVPASYGFDGEYGPGIFMVSSRGSGSTSVFLYEVTDKVEEDQDLNAFTIPSGSYDPSGNALQLGSEDVIDTGGARTRRAFYADGTVHMVFTSDYNFTFYAGIRYIRIDVVNKTTENLTIGQDQMDMAYPSIHPIGPDETSKAVMIGFLNSSDKIYPSMSVIKVDEDMVASEPVVVKMGSSPITTLSGGSQRWGDYSGGSRWHAADYPSIWFVGCYGQNNDYGNWIYEVTDQEQETAPVADFVATPRQFEIVGTTVFNSTILNGADSYAWTFEEGNPSTSTQSNPEITYIKQGKFDVELIVTNSFGSDTITKVDYINALQQPAADFTSDVVTGAAPLTVNFENLSLNQETVSWVLQGGTPSFSTEENPTVVYENPGTYNVSLVASNESGTDIDTRSGYIVVSESTATNNPDLLDELVVFPNPSSSEFKVRFFLPNKVALKIKVVDAQGRDVRTLLEGRLKAGTNEFSFNKNALSAGTYFLLIQDEYQNIVVNEKIVVFQ